MSSMRRAVLHRMTGYSVSGNMSTVDLNHRMHHFRSPFLLTFGLSLHISSSI